jgi:hypothetical protein
MHKNLVSISNQIYGVVIIQAILLMFDIHTKRVYCENHTRHINTLHDKISESWC